MTLEQAKQYVKTNYTLKKIHETKMYYRFRQYHPRENEEYRTKTLPNGIKLIIGYSK
jgi:hypothetical protein